MLFWTVTVALVAVVALLFVLALIRQRGGAEPAQSFDIEVYKQQLRDVERDLARGVIRPEEGDRLRTEILARYVGARGVTEAALADDQAVQTAKALLLDGRRYTRTLGG